ncbi:pilus assembly PilX N-terminal domain-containing protein [Pontiellaceae bacterium B12227]|nr:pilus assembly PilX N-terminal domain-containing protein [Pontiellaceae bacterium B12227]
MKASKTRKSGYALVVVMSLMAVLALAFTMLQRNSSQSAYDARRLKDIAQAATYAEAGVEFAYSLLVEDYKNRLKPSEFRLDKSSAYNEGDTLTSSYGDGTFTLKLKPSDDGKYVLVHSKGECRGRNIAVEVLVEDDNWAPPTNTETEDPPDYGDIDVFKMVLATEGDALFRGTSDVYGNDEYVIHSNGPLTVNGSIIVDSSIESSQTITIGNNKTVNGSATAPTVNTGKKGGASGGVYEKSVPEITIPELDLEPYIRHAEHYGAVKTGNTTISSDPPGGIWYVNGNVTVSGNVNATIIASGTITIANSCNLTATHGIAVANTGAGNNIEMNASKGMVTGLMYSGDGYFKQNGGDITGQVIAKLSANKGGNGVLKYKQSLPIYPEYGGPDETGSPNEPRAVIAAWQL